MKRASICIACFFFGSGIGWYFGHNRPAAKHARDLLKEYQQMRALGSESDLADVGAHFNENIASIGRTDEFAAAFAVHAILKLEQGDIERAKKTLAMGIRNYYLRYRNNGGDSNLISHIEQVAQVSPYLANAISEKPE